MGRRAPNSRRLLAVVTAIGLGVCLVGAGCGRSGRAPAELHLADLSAQPEVIRRHVTAAYRAAEAAPSSVDTVGALCLAYHADMLYDEAIRCYAAAEQLAGARAWHWAYYRALAEESRGDFEAMMSRLALVVEAAPEFAPAWWRLGNAAFKSGRPDEAERAWRRAAEVPDVVIADDSARADAPRRMVSASIADHSRLGLARIAMSRRDYDQARSILEEVTAMSPGFGPAFAALGDVYAAMGRDDEATVSRRAASRLPPYDPYVDPMLGRLIRESRSSTFLLQQAAAAPLSTNAAWREHLMRRAIQLDPQNADARYELAVMLRALGRNQEALEMFEAYRADVPDDLSVLADIGRCLSALGRYAEAEETLRRAAEVQDTAGTRYDLGLVLARTGREDLAMVEYRQALELNPNHADTLNNLGVLLAGRGRLAAAVDLFDRLVTIDPQNADARTNLGVVQLGLGDAPSAATAFREALAIDPRHARALAGLREADAR